MTKSALIDLASIEAAAKRLKGRVWRTPILSSQTLGKLAGVELFLKCECFQKTGSFKTRGALNKVLSLSKAEKAQGLITVSAGNHAQAVAWAARQINAPCAVVMPTAAPSSKIEAVKGYGAEVILHPERATLFDKLNEEREARGATFVHPFDDPVLLAGAGTVGLEILEDLANIDMIIVPIGGGGLMGGITSVVKAMQPRTKLVVVELEAGPGLSPALEAGKPVPVSRPNTLADGLTPPFVGALPLAIAQEAVDEVALVSEAEIKETMKLLLTRCKLYVEGSGAAATAALIHGRIKVPAGIRVATIISGGNVDLEKICQLD